MHLHLRSTSAAVAAGRILLLLVAVAAVAIGFAAGRGKSPTAEGVTYFCPMHPTVTSSSPGDCPICRMKLERRQPQREPVVPAGDANAFTLPVGTELRSFDSVSLAKLFDSTLEMRGPAWVESGEVGVVLLHRDEVELLAPNEEAMFSPTMPNKDGSKPFIHVRRTADPPVPWDQSTALVRVRAEDGAAFSPGQTGSVKFATRLRKGLVVRSSAVLHSPEGDYVFVVSNDRRTLTKRPVVVGNILYGYANIVSGLRQGEYVASIRTFFLDAARRLQMRAAL